MDPVSGVRGNAWRRSMLPQPSLRYGDRGWRVVRAPDGVPFVFGGRAHYIGLGIVESTRSRFVCRKVNIEVQSTGAWRVEIDRHSTAPRKLVQEKSATSQ